MLKKCIKVFGIIFIILSLCTVCFADEDQVIVEYDTYGEGNGNVPTVGDPPVNRVDPSKQWSSSTTGTKYDIKIINQDGTFSQVTYIVPDGMKDKSWGALQGYGSFGSGVDKNPMPSGAIEIYEENIVAFLRSQGRNDLADAIENGSGYHMNVEQCLKAKAPGSNDSKWYSASWMRKRIEQEKAAGNTGKGSFYWDQWGPWKNSTNAWGDPLVGDPYKGIYSKKVKIIKITPTPTPATPTPTPGTPTPGTPSPGTPTPATPTPTPTPVTGEPSITYQFFEGGANSCYPAQRTITKMAIDNEYFGVAAGNPIPTSEDLELKVNTNWIGNLKNVKKPYIKIVDAQNIWYVVDYVTEYVINKTTYTYNYDEDGNYIGRSSSEEKFDSWEPGDTPVQLPSDEYDDENRLLCEYGIDIITAEYDRKDISKDLKDQTLEYLYTGDAYVNGGATAGVVNSVLASGRADITLNGFPSVEIVKYGTYPLGCKGPYNDPSRVTELWDEFPIEVLADDYDSAVRLFNSYKPDIADFYKVDEDESLTLSAYGISKKGFNCDRKIVSQDFGKDPSYTDSFSDGIGTIPSNRENKSVGTEYVTEYAYIKVGGEEEVIYNVNGVRVHTPLHAELTVENKDPNQLTNGTLRNGQRIVTLGDEVIAKLYVCGNTKYYDRLWGKAIECDTWPSRMRKYIRYAEIVCELCDQKIDVTDEVRRNGFAEHKCRAYVNGTDDLREANIYGRVIAENANSTSYENNITNTPDSWYAIEQKKGLFIVGKIYDLEVRATDDPSWKLKNLENLSYLPIGETGDNSVSAYKNGIKLGYRAYYDLKTLGSGSSTVKLIPKIYYVDKAGNIKGEIGNQYELWYKTSSTNYEKLQSGKDIVTQMKVVTSKPDAGNIPFKEECAKLMKVLIDYGEPTIDYNKLIKTMGGLLGLTLRRDNTVATKYTYYDFSNRQVTDYTVNADKSRRWYGEIYVPASTRIIAKGNYTTNKTKVTNGTGIIKDGYLVVVFENIKSTTASGSDYLKYDEVRDPEWKVLTGIKSQLEKEKNGKGQTAAKAIKLPNGVDITAKLNAYNSGFYKKEAPIIIYDVSLRANNDYEQTGTH